LIYACQILLRVSECDRPIQIANFNANRARQRAIANPCAEDAAFPISGSAIETILDRVKLHRKKH